MAAPAVAYPNGRHIIVCGGADGVLMTMLEHNGVKAQSENVKEADAFAEFNRALLGHHPGFSRDVLSYDTEAKTWTKIGNFPDLCPVTTPGVLWNGHIFIPSGETSPGVRTPKVWRGVFENDL